MAQRSFSCPECGADVYIPDNYFKTAILCGSCGAAVSRHDGELYGGDTEGLGAAPSEPPPGGPGATPSGSSSKLMLVVILALMLIGGVLGAVFLIGPGESEDVGLSTEDWVEHKSREGGFTATFPAEPTTISEAFATDSGLTKFTRNWARGLGGGDIRTFDVMYTNDVPGGSGAARNEMRAMLRTLAENNNGEVTKISDVNVSGVAGLRGEVRLSEGRLMTALLLRAEFRLFVAYVENHTSADAEAVAKFFDSLKLDPGVAEPTRMQARAVIPAYFKVGEERRSYLETGEERQWYIEVTGGTMPFRTSRSPSLPEGLRGEFVDRRYAMKGAPLIVGNTRVEFAFEDAFGQPLSFTHEFRVVPSEGPVLFGGSFVRPGVEGVSYKAWVEIVNHVPGIVEYDVVWNDFDLPDGLIAEHVTVDRDKAFAGLDTKFDYIVVTGDPKRVGTSRCKVTLKPEPPEDSNLEPEEQTFTFEIEIKQSDD